MGPQWELSVDDSKVSSGLIPYCSNTSLFRETVCLPRNSCGTFHISNSNYTWGQIRYSLAMDDVTYRSKSEYSGRADGWNETTNLGKCTADSLCDASSQALFEVDLLTSKKYVNRNDKSLPLIPQSWRNIWTFQNRTKYYSKDEYTYQHHPPLLRSRDYANSFELGLVYRTIECVPIDAECDFDFTMDEESATVVLEKYEVRRNGMALSRAVVEETDHWDTTTVKEVTAFGENCSTNKLSEGAIAWIVIGSIAAVIVVYAFWYTKMKKKEAFLEEDTNNPLTESLLAEAGGTERMTDYSGDGTTP